MARPPRLLGASRPGSRTLNIAYLTGFFGALTALLAVWAGLRVLRGLPDRMERRIEAEVAERVALMHALARRWPEAHGEEREALARNYRFHRSAVLCLRPQLAVDDIESARAAPPPRRLAA